MFNKKKMCHNVLNTISQFLIDNNSYIFHHPVPDVLKENSLDKSKERARICLHQNLTRGPMVL